MWQTRGMAKQIQNRYLLCRPEGGLNDILSEIGKCISYGRKFGRYVIVETNSHSHEHFKDVFGHYFDTNDEKLLLDSEFIKKNFDGMDVQPAFLAGQINIYKNDVEELRRQNTVVSFDFTKDYEEPLLVHHSNGQQKRRNALIALSQLALKQNLLEALSVRLGVIGDCYHAFHIRHTDYKTDFKSKVLALAPQIKGRVFLATDNKSVVDFFEDAFGNNRVTTFSKLPDKVGEPLHYGDRNIDYSQKNADAILDLLTLALADHYHFFPRESSGYALVGSYSGFSALAARLRFSPHILRLLLSSEFHGRIKSPSLRDRLQNVRWLYF